MLHRNVKSMNDRVRSMVLALVLAAPAVAAALQGASAAPLDGIGGPMALTTNDTGHNIPGGLAVLNDGTAFLAYYTIDASGVKDTYVSRYTPTGGWQPGVLVEDNWTADSWPVAIGADGRGNAYVAMMMEGASETDIYLAQYWSGEGWVRLDKIDELPGAAQTPSLAVDRNGWVFIAWYQDDGAYYSTFARRLTPAGFWEPVVNVESLSGHGYNAPPSVGVDAFGNGMVLWNQDYQGALHTFANRYTSGSGWATAGPIDAGPGDTVTARLAMAFDGRALAAWSNQDNGTGHVYSKWYTPGTGWGNLTLHANATGYIQAATPAIDGAYGGMVAWAKHDGSRYNGWADRFSYAAGWEGAALFENIDDNLPNQFETRQLAADGAGSYLVAYHSSHGSTSSLNTAAYIPGGGWLHSAHVDDTAEAVHAPVVALNDAGAGWVAWAQYNASRNQLWVAAYQTRDIRPPTLDVEFPQNEMHLTEPSVRVEGSVYDATRVTVNGVEAEIGFDERFSLLIPLASGLNEVRVTASDDSGNEDSYIAAVYFDDPAVALQAQLDAANASLAKALLDVANATAQVGALTTQLADANAAVAEAQANVTAAQQAIDALEASGSATQDDLDAAQAALAAAEANVATLTTAQASLSSQLSTATANAAAALAAANSAQANATAAQTAAAGQTAAVSDAKASAGSAYTIGMLGLVLGLVGIALGAVGMMRKPKAMESAHQNPMYHDDGKTGDNPLHEKKE